jgi:hypothetical protein
MDVQRYERICIVADGDACEQSAKVARESRIRRTDRVGDLWPNGEARYFRNRLAFFVCACFCPLFNGTELSVIMSNIGTLNTAVPTAKTCPAVHSRQEIDP